MADGGPPSASHGSQPPGWVNIEKEDAQIPPACDQDSYGGSSTSSGPKSEPSKLTSWHLTSNAAFLTAGGAGSNASATGHVPLTTTPPSSAYDARVTADRASLPGGHDFPARPGEGGPAAIAASAAAARPAAVDGSSCCRWPPADDQLVCELRQLKQDLDDLHNTHLSMEVQQLLPPVGEKAGSDKSRQLLTQATRFSLETMLKDQLLGTSQAYAEKLERRCAQLESASASVCEENKQLKMENERLLQKISRVEKERDNVSLPSLPSESRVVVVQDRRQQSETGTQPADALASLTAQLQAMQDKCEKQKTKLDQMASANRRWDEHCKKIEELRSAEMHNYEHTISQQAERITELEQTVRNLNARLDEVNANEAKRQKDIDRLLLSTKKRLETVEAERDALSENLRHTEHERTLASRGLVAARHDADQLQATCDHLQQQLLELQQQQQRQVRTSSAGPTCDAQAAELMEQNAVLRQQIEVYRDDFNSERNDRERLQQKVLDLQRQYERLRGDFLTLQQKSSRTEEELARVRAEASRLQAQLSMQAAEIRTLRQATVSPWRCGTCTFNNPAGRKYCEICGIEGGSLAASGVLESRSARPAAAAHLFSASPAVLPSAPNETGCIGGAHTSNLSAELVVTDSSPSEGSSTRTETRTLKKN